MGRMTFDELVQQSQDICVDDQSVSYTGMTDTLTFIKREINNTISDIHSLMKEYRLEPPPKTIRTEAEETYYAYPSGLLKAESFTIDIGSITPPLKIVQSQQEWDNFQQVAIISGFPTHVFPRRDDFGLYPTPSDAFTLTITGSYHPVRMTAGDYQTGVVAVTNNSDVITTTGGSFTQSMVGRWFSLSDGTTLTPNGEWYRVDGYISTTQMRLSRPYGESTAQGQTYIIAQSPELPEELHQYIPYKVGSVYWHTRRHDSVRAQELANYYYTGDFNNTRRTGSIRNGILATLHDMQTNGRGNGPLIETKSRYFSDGYLNNTIWGTTISDNS